jgi:hypothetical protein
MLKFFGNRFVKAHINSNAQLVGLLYFLCGPSVATSAHELQSGPQFESQQGNFEWSNISRGN